MVPNSMKRVIGQVTRLVPLSTATGPRTAQHDRLAVPVVEHEPHAGVARANAALDSGMSPRCALTFGPADSVSLVPGAALGLHPSSNAWE